MLTVGGGGVGEVVLTVGGVEVWSLTEQMSLLKFTQIKMIDPQVVNLSLPSSRVEQRGAVEAGPMPALVLACMRTPYLVEGFRLVRT